MPVKLEVLSERGLVYLRYDGYVKVQEALDSLEEYKAHPNFHPGHKHFVDFTRITGFEHDYVKVFALQAEVAAALVKDGFEILLVMLANNDPSKEMAHLVRKSWEGVTTVVPVTVETEAEALELLGQPERSTSDLLRALREKS